MITCLVVDDEQSAVDLLCAFIRKTPFLTLAGATTNPLEALSLLQAQPVDLLFLDIHMPQLSGLDLLRLLPSATRVVLTTAYSEFAVQGFELNVLDYLLKPIAFERFLKAAQKARPAAAPLPTPVLSAPPEAAAADYLFVKTESKGKMAKVDFADIVYIEGLKNYVAIQTDSERIVTLLNLKDLEDRLPARYFMRVHKSYLVSLDKIRALDGNQIFLKGTNTFVPLGDTYRSAFLDTLQVMGGRR